MIKKLRRKFIFIAVFSLFLVELIIIGTINIINIYQLNQKSDSLLHMISENVGVFPDFNKGKPDNRPPNEFYNMKHDDNINPETRYMTRYFNVIFNNSGKIISVDTGHIAAITSDTAIDYAQKALDKGKIKGWFENYKYQITDYDENKLIVFIDCRSQMEMKYQFIAISSSIGFLGFVVVSVLIAIFSKWAIKPAIESFEKQKQFITDAGHEIKTPLAIISANTEVLELNSGENEWTNSIKNQTKRLAQLINNLLTLSKMEEDIKMVFEKFDLSNAVFDSAHPFKTVAVTQNKVLDIDICDNIEYVGDETMIRQLVSILVDNAVKYADTNSTIKLILSKEPKGIKLSVFNNCTDIPNINLSKLFDRFYRADVSRSRETGGYGIGLSIANAIVQAHKSKITAKAITDGIVFEVTLK